VLTGCVDDQLRALIRIPIRSSQHGPLQEIAVWVDTAFTCGLTIPQGVIAGLGLSKKSSLEAVLAEGQTVVLETFDCYLDWFGSTYRLQAIASDGAFPLLGTELLAGRRLTIDYAAKTVELT
jgi:predicted aspartyl protease